MSTNTEEPEQLERQVMLAATSMLKPPRAVTKIPILDRTAPWRTVLWVAGLGIVGLLFGLIIFRSNITMILLAAATGGGAGYMASEWSPLKGETLTQWLGLTIRSRAAKRVEVGNRHALLYVGTFPLKRTALGNVHMSASGIAVSTTVYDERGYPQLAQPKSSHVLLHEQKLRKSSRKSGLKASGTLRPRDARSMLRQTQKH